MLYEFRPPSLKDRYENEKWMKKKYGITIAEGMMKFLGALDAADNAYDIKAILSFCMEHKMNNLKEYYSVSLDKKKSKWRVLIQMLDENDEVCIPNENEVHFLKSIKKIRIKEISDHYAEY